MCNPILLCILSVLPAAVFAQEMRSLQQSPSTSSPYEKVLSSKKDQAVTKVNAISSKTDSIIQNIQDVPAKYITRIDNKIDKYSSRITSKTEKTLAKLSKWETKIKGLLEKVSPETAQKLFGNGQITFSTLLQKVREGKAVADGYKVRYNEYRDKIYTSLHYLETQKEQLDKGVIQPLQRANQKMEELEMGISNSEAVEAFIKQRKHELLDQAVKYIGKSKYLQKINKEAYYYVETLHNYKEIFSDPAKAEETALNILNKIPAFKQFVQQNSMLSSLFRTPSGSFDPSTQLAGLQTRANIQYGIQDRIATGGPNAIDQVRQQIQAGQAELSKLKDKMAKYGTADGEKPDFKVNSQKSKTTKQRLVCDFNFQFGKSNNYLPGSTDIAVSVGYKLDDKKIAGFGVAYKMGLGSWNNIRLTSQGINFRSYLDWKIKGNFFISGGYEQNYNSQFKNIQQLKDCNAWQSSGLIGITKKVKIKGSKSAKMQVLWDFLSHTHVPVTQAFVFRTGFSFK
jgi:hypothetical protein